MEFEGSIIWILDEAATFGFVTRAIETPDKLSLDVDTDGERYTVTMKPVPNEADRWVGRWVFLSGERVADHADARAYRHPSGRLVLVGLWRDDGDNRWVAELSPRP